MDLFTGKLSSLTNDVIRAILGEELFNEPGWILMPDMYVALTIRFENEAQ